LPGKIAAQLFTANNPIKNGVQINGMKVDVDE
jgi:hypothetical protein